MYIVKLINLKTNKEFEKVFWDYKKFKNFVQKCKNSDKLKITAILDNSKYYD